MALLPDHHKDLLGHQDLEDLSFEVGNRSFDQVFLGDDVIVGLVDVLANVRELQRLPNGIFVLVHFVQELLHVLAWLQLDVVLNASLFDEPKSNVKVRLVVMKLTQAFSMFPRAF